MGKRGIYAAFAVGLAGAGLIAGTSGVAGAGISATTGGGAAHVRARAQVTTVTARTQRTTRKQSATATARTRTSTAAAQTQAAAATTLAQGTVREGICTAPVAYKALASKLSADIKSALHGRAGDHAVTVYDRVTGVNCSLSGGSHFDSASIIKAIILATLLRWHQETRTPPSSTEKYEATLMITQSDNGAATYLWNEVGMSRLQHLLNLAGMHETELNAAWGLTQATAHDEMLLLRLLTGPNRVLSNASRAYQLGLMNKVVSWQRWGTPYGAPRTVTVHVKNGWLPENEGWHINSIGAFTSKTKNYMMAVLSDENPSEQYGIDTIQDVARLVHRDVNAAKPAAKAQLAANVAKSAALPTPDPSSWAVVPALENPPVAP